jgi:hypothetical protein
VSLYMRGQRVVRIDYYSANRLGKTYAMKQNEQKILRTALKAAHNSTSAAAKLASVAPDNVRADLSAAIAYLDSAMKHVEASDIDAASEANG